MTTKITFKIRLISPENAADYRSIRLAAMANAPGAFGSTYETESARPMSSFVERVTTSSIFGAYVDRNIVGMAGFARHPGPKQQHKGYLWGMYVEPSLRGIGIGKALVAAVLHHAAAEVEQVTLAVVTTNLPAIALYKSLGFESYGIEPRALKSDYGYADEMWMIRYLTEPFPE